MFKYITKEKLFTREWFVSWSGIVFGAFLLAGSFALFINPYKIVPGGVYGLGIILNSYFPDIKVGTFGLLLDIPLLIISLRIFGATFGAKTVVAALLTPIFMNLFATYCGETPSEILSGHLDLSDDVFLASLFGGVIMGVGLGLIFRNKATSGGTDIISMIISKYMRLPLSKSIIIVESIIVVIGIITLGDWKLPLYALVAIFSCVKMIDYIIEGATDDKILFIISDKHEQIRSYILNEMDRGGTYIKAKGMYEGRDKEMIFLVISRKELPIVQSFIKGVDSDVFMVIVNAHEAFGMGFRSIENR